MRTSTFLLAAALGLALLAPASAPAKKKTYADTFLIETCTWATTGVHPFFDLTPGYRLVLETDPDDGICRENGSVFYHGEDVDNYDETGTIVVNHDGAWRAGVAGARAGVIMPGLPLLGARYFQEVAPDVAMDRAEITRLDATVATPAGTFERCLETKETTPLERGKSIKAYAPGVGLVRDDDLLLTERP